jgi:CRISPR-associated helicase Cas3
LPQAWLAHDFARIAAGPVVVPPVTDAMLDYWSATTDARSPHLSPHPFLYGLAEDDEGTPLVGVAFRLETEALRENVSDQDDTETPDAATEVLEIFKRFPPLRAELHQVKLSAVRDWLASPEAEQHPLVYRERDKWRAKATGESAAAAAAALGPGGVLILPASALIREPCKKLLEHCEQPIGKDGKDTAISDVFDGVSDPRCARYLRTIEPAVGRTGSDGAWLWNVEGDENKNSASVAKSLGFQQRLRKELRAGGQAFVFRYFRPANTQGDLQFLDDHNGAHGHLSRAKEVAARLAEAIAPGDSILRTLLSDAARHHDEGKRYPKWQRAFGRPKDQPEIAKLHPDLKKPAPLGGFRHEWESLRQLSRNSATPPTGLSPEAHALWRDLLLHIVGVHHGHLRPSINDDGLTPNAEAGIHNPLRLEAAERFARLQCQLGPWRLAYLEALLKTADAEGSRDIPDDEDDDGN